ncbi:AAA family ATPase [Nocardia vinacea]|uniref:nucleotide-binding protein n=1 Tax=Nocardia vinacea TaxID=96468 RepID=UPI003F4DF4A3
MSRNNDGLPMLPPWLSESDVTGGYEAPVQNLPHDDLIDEAPSRRGRSRRAPETERPEAARRDKRRFGRRKGKDEQPEEQGQRPGSAGRQLSGPGFELHSGPGGFQGPNAFRGPDPQRGPEPGDPHRQGPPQHDSGSHARPDGPGQGSPHSENGWQGSNPLPTRNPGQLSAGFDPLGSRPPTPPSQPLVHPSGPQQPATDYQQPGAGQPPAFQPGAGQPIATEPPASVEETVRYQSSRPDLPPPPNQAAAQPYSPAAPPQPPTSERPGTGDFDAPPAWLDTPRTEQGQPAVGTGPHTPAASAPAHPGPTSVPGNRSENGQLTPPPQGGAPPASTSGGTDAPAARLDEPHARGIDGPSSQLAQPHSRGFDGPPSRLEEPHPQGSQGVDGPPTRHDEPRPHDPRGVDSPPSRLDESRPGSRTDSSGPALDETRRAGSHGGDGSAQQLEEAGPVDSQGDDGPPPWLAPQRPSEEQTADEQGARSGQRPELPPPPGEFDEQSAAASGIPADAGVAPGSGSAAGAATDEPGAVGRTDQDDSAPALAAEQTANDAAGSAAGDRAQSSGATPIFDSATVDPTRRSGGSPRVPSTASSEYGPAPRGAQDAATGTGHPAGGSPSGTTSSASGGAPHDYSQYGQATQTANDDPASVRPAGSGAAPQAPGQFHHPASAPQAPGGEFHQPPFAPQGADSQGPTAESVRPQRDSGSAAPGWVTGADPAGSEFPGPGTAPQAPSEELGRPGSGPQGTAAESQRPTGTAGQSGSGAAQRARELATPGWAAHPVPGTTGAPTPVVGRHRLPSEIDAAAEAGDQATGATDTAGDQQVPTTEQSAPDGPGDQGSVAGAEQSAVAEVQSGDRNASGYARPASGPQAPDTDQPNNQWHSGTGYAQPPSGQAPVGEQAGPPWQNGPGPTGQAPGGDPAAPWQSGTGYAQPSTGHTPGGDQAPRQSGPSPMGQAPGGDQAPSQSGPVGRAPGSDQMPWQSGPGYAQPPIGQAPVGEQGGPPWQSGPTGQGPGGEHAPWQGGLTPTGQASGSDQAPRPSGPGSTGQAPGSDQAAQWQSGPGYAQPSTGQAPVSGQVGPSWQNGPGPTGQAPGGDRSPWQGVPGSGQAPGGHAPWQGGSAPMGQAHGNDQPPSQSGPIGRASGSDHTPGQGNSALARRAPGGDQTPWQGGPVHTGQAPGSDQAPQQSELGPTSQVPGSDQAPWHGASGPMGQVPGDQAPHQGGPTGQAPGGDHPPRQGAPGYGQPPIGRAPEGEQWQNPAARGFGQQSPSEQPADRWQQGHGPMGQQAPVGDPQTGYGQLPAGYQQGGQYQPQHPHGPQPSLDDVPLRRAKKSPSGGWRKAVHHVSGGAINPGLSAEELRLQELVARIRQPVRGDYRIAVLSLKGGVGKTTTTMGLGSIFASIRGDRVIAVDANPDFGTLSQRVPLQTRSTVRDLLLDPAIQRYSDVRRHTSQGTSRLEVLASERDPAASEAFNDEEYRAVARILQRFYNIILTDCGTGLMHSAMGGVLDLAHSLVLISSAAIDGARSAAATLDWLSLHGHDHLVRNAVVVINLPREGSPNVGIQQLREYFLSRCRAVHIIPYDSHLSEGAEIDLHRLHKTTKRAYVELAATVADEFGIDHRRYSV